MAAKTAKKQGKPSTDPTAETVEAEPLLVRYVTHGPLLTEDGKPCGGVSPGFVEESPTAPTLHRVGHVRITREQYVAAPRKVPKR